MLPEALGLDGRQLGRGAHQAEVGAPHPSVMHERVDDPVGRGVDRYREAEADPGDRGVDPDDAAVAVGQRAPGVAWVECRVGLDDVLDQARRLSGARRHAAAEGADDARGHRAREPERVADGDHQRADEQRVCVAVLGRGRQLSVGADDGEVGQRVSADHAEVGRRAVGELGRASVGIADDVGVGDKVGFSVRTTPDPADSPRPDRIRSAATLVSAARRPRW